MGAGVSEGLFRLAVRVNSACHEAYRGLLVQGFRTGIQGVAMTRRNEAGYHQPRVYVLDDWR
jgi:hypothetical protein